MLKINLIGSAIKHFIKFLLNQSKLLQNQLNIILR